MKVAFIGAGVYGRALGDLAESNGHEVRYFDPYKFPEVTLESAVDSVDLVVYVAPGSAVSEIVDAKKVSIPDEQPLLVDPSDPSSSPGSSNPSASEYIIPSDTPFLCASKGIATPYPFRRFRNFTALNGAAFAADIATDSPRLGDKIRLTSSSAQAEELFTAPKIAVEFFSDTRGIMLCGALKVLTSVYAGYANPAGFSDVKSSVVEPSIAGPSFVESVLTTRKSRQDFLAEIRPEWEKWLDANGCSRELMQLSCGFPDVIISTTPNSRNFVYGQQLRQDNKTPEGTVEGVTIAKTLKNYPDLVIPENSVLADFAEKLTKINAETAKTSKPGEPAETVETNEAVESAEIADQSNPEEA